MCHFCKKKGKMSRLSHCYHLFGPGLLLTSEVPAMGCCNIPVASLRRFIYHRGWEILTSCVLLNTFKTLKHSPNAYLRLQMNVHDSHIVISSLDIYTF